MTKSFPMDVSAYRPLTLDAKQPLDERTLAQWRTNIQTVRDTLLFFTASAGLRGVDGHTGGAYDLVPEALLADGFIRGSNDVYPILFDEAGHRVALQYAMAAFNGDIGFDLLLKYRAHGHGLYGHVERNEKMGIGFSSGRLGHLWSMVNGVALAHPGKSVLMFGSDGSQMDGGDAEAARFAVAHRLNVKLLIDDNITCAGNPSAFMPGFDVAKTLEGHSLPTDTGDGEDLPSLYARFAKALAQPGPVALINKRVMAPGMGNLEGTADAYGEIGPELAATLLRAHGHEDAARYLEEFKLELPKRTYRGSSPEKGSTRQAFGQTAATLVGSIPAGERKAKVLAVDTDLASSVGLGQIEEQFPECFVQGGIMERNNFSAAAGFGFDPGRTGIFSTFAAFMEMLVSELTMARLNEVNLLCHFSHCGVDMIPDNTCHYGMNIFFADNGLIGQHPTPLYFPADPLQMEAVVKKVFFDPGIRFVFSTRPSVPFILDDRGERFFEPGHYTFEPGWAVASGPGSWSGVTRRASNAWASPNPERAAGRSRSASTASNPSTSSPRSRNSPAEAPSGTATVTVVPNLDRPPFPHASRPVKPIRSEPCRHRVRHLGGGARAPARPRHRRAGARRWGGRLPHRPARH